MNLKSTLLRHLSIGTVMVCAALACCAAPAVAQQSPAAASPSANPAVAPAPPTTKKSTAQLDAGEPRAAAAPDGQTSGDPRPARAAARATSNAGSKPSGPKAPAAADRLDLNTATVTGDREQPKVMYIVPWKKSDIGDLSGKPMNSLLDEALSPVDRDEFRREVAYYGAVGADPSQNGASKAAKQGEK